MLPKLLKFVLRTRFSRPFLILIAVVFTYSVLVFRYIPPTGFVVIFGYYASGMIALFLAMALATGGVMVLKSDRDYLFTLPLSPRDLSISIFFAQFIAFGTTILLVFLYMAEAITSPLIIVDLVALALTLTSLGIVAPAMTTRVRVALSIGLALWTLLAFTGFPFTPGSAFNGSVYGGTATLVGLTAVTMAAAFRGLGRIELDMMRSMVRTTSADVKSPSSFAGKTPIGAIYSMNLANMSLAGRVNMMGTSRYVSKRVKTWWVVAAATAAAAAYLLVALSTSTTTFAPGTDNGVAAIITAVGLSFIAFYFSQSAITNERLWLSLTSLPAASYFRHLTASKLVSLMLVLAPFAAADAILFALGRGEGLGALAVVLLVIPGAFVLEVCWAAYIAPIQIKGDDMMMPAQFNLRQFATVFPMAGAMVFVLVASLFPLAAAVGGLALCGISALLVLSPGFWKAVVTRLTENGFI